MTHADDLSILAAHIASPARSASGYSSRQGSHHVAQKLTRSGLPVVLLEKFLITLRVDQSVGSCGAVVCGAAKRGRRGRTASQQHAINREFALTHRMHLRRIHCYLHASCRLRNPTSVVQYESMVQSLVGRDAKRRGIRKFPAVRVHCTAREAPPAPGPNQRRS